MFILFKLWNRSVASLRVASMAFSATFFICHASQSYAATSLLSQQPLFATKPVVPMMMLNMSKDHQLYFKAYDDYSNLSGDLMPETTYVHSYDYYGYFDSKKCYYYDTSDKIFKPGRWANASNYCNHTAIGSETARVGKEWSGNFLNWATMTRMDTVRKILYGGMRSTDDSSGLTVLERAFLPNDAHSFTKYYNGSDVHQLVGLSAGTVLTNDTDLKKNGITICNTTTDSSGFSQESTAAPRMLVAKGNFSLWASNERYQCRWGNGNANSNDPAESQIFAYSDSPDSGTNGIGEKDYNVRVQVCSTAFVDSEPLVSGSKVNNEKCLRYPNNYYKPVGLLQTYGANDSIHFGLMTGSYGKNKSGGVLRKNIGTFTNEIDSNDGRILTPSGGNIVTNINKLRIYGYRFDDGTYFGVSKSDDCEWGQSSFVNGKCSNWGNPQTEIFLESLRYYAGLGKTSNFSSTDSDYISGLVEPAWSNPVTSANKCAPLNVLQFNASVSSYDNDEVDTNIGSIQGKNRPNGSAVNLNVVNQTNAVGAGEGLDNKPFFIADNGVLNNGLCTSKTLTTLAQVTGICPEGPGLGASYRMAGLAYYANMFGVNVDRETVKTYGVALQPSIPSVSIPVPGSRGVISILPACRNSSLSPEGNCAIVDFKIVRGPVLVDGKNEGTLYVNWEDSEQGGDYDQDMWGIIKYSVSSSTVSITTNTIAQSTPYKMGFGYVIGGTLQDGFHVHSGINGFSFNDSSTTDCENGCNVSDAQTTQTYDVGASTTGRLESPLFYAAKWGGFEREKEVYNPSTKQFETQSFTEPPKDSNGVWLVPDTFFYSTNPRTLEAALSRSFQQISLVQGSASAVATNSTRVDGDRLVYQSRFRTKNWSGQVLAYRMDSKGDVITKNPDGTSAAVWDTDKTVLFPASHTSRKVYMLNDATKVGVEFLWANLSATQKTTFKGGVDDDVLATKKLNWLRGDTSEEGSLLRKRDSLIGDIVNSDPAYAGQQKFAWSRLPVTYNADGSVASDIYGATSYRDYVTNKKSATSRVPMLLVGANDGMLHVLNANTGSELFSYVPRGVFDKLRFIPNNDYIAGGKHLYSMDGSIFVGDVYDSSRTSDKWRTYAVGTLGAGGKGVFVLDITDIDKDGNGFDPSKHVVLDFTEADFPSGELGFVLNRPVIVPMKDGKWYAVFGNGLESTSAKSQLILIDLKTKAIRKVDTGSTGGLMAPALLPNNDMVMEFAYAGDLQGNLWKFDLTNTNASSWTVSHKSGSTPVPFAVLTRDGSTKQPITAAPTLGIRFASTGVKAATMVYVGTGRYLYTGDNVPSTNIQSFYGLADEEETSGSDARVYWTSSAQRDSLLHKKQISTETSSPNGVRTIKGEGRNAADVTDQKPNWTNKLGWYIDLVPPSSTGQGEMVISKSLLLYDRLVFPTLIPSDQSCSLGGKGWVMDLSGVGDRYGVTHRILPESGMELEVPVMSLSESIESGDKIYIPVSNIKGEVDVIKGQTPPKAPKGRSSWRQIK